MRKSTPLHEIADNISAPSAQNIAEYLIQNGAELEAKDGIKRTPLQCAVGAFKTADFKYLGMVECLITYGADVNAGHILHSFPTPMKMATLMKNQTEFSVKGIALDKLLLKYGAEPFEEEEEEVDPQLQDYLENLSENELKVLGDLAEKDLEAFQKEIRKRRGIIGVPINDFFDVMKKLNNPE